ncbi:hypothetical protein [Paractinoplanes globisporus]|uniref:Uncharacterized protein n=1 Tax=Paractinoplanes globisporus TaxID=113565 RepID=A0ABW6WLM3_9ACTN|nr:hypothetical protein [Actinoplanes globisporus]
MSSVVLYGDVYAAYGQIYVNRADGSNLGAYFSGPDGTGLIGVVGNGAVLGTGLHTGYVLLTVTMDPEDPGAALSDFEDVVEVSMTTDDERFILFCWGGEETHDLSPLPAGGTTYRLRYHARGLDQATGKVGRGIDDPPLDEYLLQIWPSRYEPPALPKLTSRSAQAMQRTWRL